MMTSWINSIDLMVSASAAYNAFLIECISHIFKALSCLQGHLGCIYISCTQILLYKSWLLSQAQYVCGIHYLIWLMLMLACTILFSPLFTGHLIHFTLSRWAQVCLPRHLQHRYSLIKETCHTCKSRLLRVYFFQHFGLPYTSLSLTSPSTSSD